ncbi:restriction endonuclease PLD domain-containing protein [Flavonifractor sp. An306]|uniref:restriction endonuclease PLD domain-containing protein n=1 Tax=Flavonifractor sp. An306 TaxID=1965629 RepID=UPI0017488982|nr:restriction endonuclease PLD domain-containing protein [Flavonifractor sp. An306]
MNLLYSNILPLGTKEGQETVSNQISEEISNSDAIEIAVGYVSKASLEELDRIVTEHQIRHVILTIGMYFVEGMPEAMYHTAVAINQKWVAAGIGEIRMVRAFKYHGKLYAFYKDQQVKSAIIGSANLGVIKQEAANRRQYEVSAITVEQSECDEIATLIRKLASPACSARIDEITGMTLIREVNVSLTGVDTVDQLPQTQVELFEKHKTDISFILPIKVPAYAERHMDDGKHYTKSNLNVSYAAPRSARKSRDWYETQFTVSKKITLLPGYPEKNIAFYVITDDGYTFKAHTTSDGNKQFSAVGDELILGRWIKGRLAAAGLVTPVNDTQLDVDRTGMITKEMLAAYGCNTLVLTKTNQKMEDEEGNMLDVWILSFEAASQDEGDEA